jgi:hypothetical protein
MCICFALAAAIMMAATAGASADGIESAYSKIELEGGSCLLLTPPQEIEEMQGAEFVCPGHAGIVVWVGEGDLRFFLGYGSHGRSQCSYGQTLSAFNTIGDTLEWRLHEADGEMRPFATILRYTVDSDNGEGQFLVVTKLDSHEACHMAYVSVDEPDANTLAREAADKYGPTFNCGEDEAFLYSARGPEYENRPGSSPRCLQE